MFQIGYYVNYVMILLETILSVIIVFFISKFINKPLLKNNQVSIKEKNITFAVSSFIVIGLILALRYTFGFFGFLFDDFQIFGSGVSKSFENIGFLFYAIMVTLFFPLYKIFFMKICRNHSLEGIKMRNKNYFRRSVLLIGVSWVIALVFLSIDILDIDIGHLIPPDSLSPDYDIFLLGFEWAFLAVMFDIAIAYSINRSLPIRKRLSREELNNSLTVAGIVSFSVWSIQLIIVELYLVRYFSLTLYKQDIRILATVIAIIFILSFFISLKLKFGPEVALKSMKEIELAKQLFTGKKIQKSKNGSIILDVNDLTTYFYTEEGMVRAVEGISFKIYEGEVLGIVGETGCGKSVTALSILQLIRHPGKIVKGSVKFLNNDLLKREKNEILPFRGRDITMIFQDPLNSLNPVFKVGNQISEVYLLHKRNELLVETSKGQNKSIYSVAREMSQQLLRELNIPAPEKVFDRYPHELSGGMRQRVQIAMALACSPKLLIADEPTTALDVTVQNQILKLMKELKSKYNTSILFITHDLGIISKMCDRVAVMYSGFIVEYGKITKLFTKPYHPYSKGLIASVPVVGKKKEKLAIIQGIVPNLIYPPPGCRFHPRCDYCFELCDSVLPENIEVEPDYFVACHLYDPQYKDLAELSLKRINPRI
ncbi:MAG: ABC transporter ATP-binding protein [Candidatus Thorarchaeota archaeon]